MRRLPALALLWLALPAWGQGPAALEAQLKQTYTDRMVVLRTAYSGERLRFDAAGQPLGPARSPPGPPTPRSGSRRSR